MDKYLDAKAVFSLAFRIFIAVFVTLCIAFFTRYFIGGALLADESSAAWFLGIFGSMYALVAAFVLVTVWEQFNSLSKAIATEAKSLTSIWNYVDYLDDPTTSAYIKEALLSYIDTTLKDEFRLHNTNERVVHASEQLHAIHRVIDSIDVHDPKDQSSFQALISAYEQLCTARKDRIELSATKIPPTVRSFFALVSVSFLLSYILHSFRSALLYYGTLAVLSLVVAWAYHLIDDLDSPLQGVWNVSLTSLKDSRDYISSTEHLSNPKQ